MELREQIAQIIVGASMRGRKDSANDIADKIITLIQTPDSNQWRQLGELEGILGALISQSTDMGEYYYIPTDVFEKAECMLNKPKED